MPRSLLFSQEALDGLEHIQTYLSLEFGELIASTYEADLHYLLATICEYPAMFPFLDKTKDSSLHKCVFKHHTIILYSFSSETVTIVGIYDARSNWKAL